MHLLSITAWLRMRFGRTSSASRRKAAIDQLAPEYSGPPLIALARVLYASRPEIRIEPLETDCRARGDGFEVRAWIKIGAEDMPAAHADEIAASLARLAAVSPAARRIFFLSSAYHIRISDIALLVAMRPAAVRRSLVQAIASLDRSEA